MKNKINLVILTLLIIILAIGLYFVIQRVCRNRCNIVPEAPVNNTINQSSTDTPLSEDIEIVPTMDDKLASDTAWCGTFQLVWNDMVNEIVKQDVKFLNEESEMADNLNKQEFTEASISEKYYYKTFGKKTLALKEEIEKGIKEKFNETSDILNDLDWSEEALDSGEGDTGRWLFYTMLKREFSFEKEFTKLENGMFADKYENIKYFGIDDSTEEEVRDQVDVLYYETEDDCAVTLNTKEGDQVVLCKGINGTTFNEIYENMMEKSENYSGKKTFQETDYLKVPEIAFNVKKEYNELEDKIFEEADGDIAVIVKAIQSIQMNMDEKGGSIKSEAVIDMVDKAAIMPTEEQPRYFNFDNEYVIFIIEKEKEKPYFATCVRDITKFQ